LLYLSSMTILSQVCCSVPGTWQMTGTVHMLLLLSLAVT